MNETVEYIVKTFRIPLAVLFYGVGCFNLYQAFDIVDDRFVAGIVRLIVGGLFVGLGLVFFLILGYWR